MKILIILVKLVDNIGNIENIDNFSVDLTLSFTPPLLVLLTSGLSLDF